LEKAKIDSNIGINAFAYCTNLNELELGDNVEVIEDDAFKECENLAKVKLPNNLKTIKKGAFGGCKSLKEVEWKGTIYKDKHEFNKNFKDVVWNEF
jgi:hypothetical protein